MFSLYLSTFITFFVITDPLGTAAVFVGLTSHYSEHHKRLVAIKAIILAFFILLFFAVFGAPLLQKLSISISSFRIAGGLLLFVTAFRMLFGHNEPEDVDQHKSLYADRADIAVFPLAIPLLSGPGCITLAILSFEKTEGLIQWFIVLCSVLTVSIVTLMCLLAAARVQKLIGKSGTNVCARVMGIILAALSVQFIIDGLKPYFN
jgi:multiple antibiotic resistance protein